MCDLQTVLNEVAIAFTLQPNCTMVSLEATETTFLVKSRASSLLHVIVCWSGFTPARKVHIREFVLVQTKQSRCE